MISKALFEGLIYGGKFVFQNRLGYPIVGRKFAVFALFYFVFEGNFPSTILRGAYIWKGDLTEGLLHYRFGGLILFWRGLYMDGLIFRILWYTSCWEVQVTGLS